MAIRARARHADDRRTEVGKSRNFAHFDRIV
jgi:hypothetical protein